MQLRGRSLGVPAPESDGALYVWVFCLMGGYLIARYGINFRRRTRTEPGPAVFDAGTFAISAMVLWGVLDSRVLIAIGSTKPFLLVAGFFGVLYALDALKPRSS